MKDTVYVSGHKNPDTDSIISAICYADLKNRLGDVDAIPIRLGKLNQETKFVLDYFGVEAPILKESMILQVSDLNIDKSYAIDPSIPVRVAWDIFQEGLTNSLAVVDNEGKIIGIASLSNITKSYMDVWDDKIIGRANTPIENIIDVLSAKILSLPENQRPFDGKMTVMAMNDDNQEFDNYFSQGDIVIVGNRIDYMEYLITRKVSLVILTNGSTIDEDLIDYAMENDVTILSTEYNTFMTSRLLPMTIPVSHVMTEDDLVYFSTTDTIDLVRETMAKSRFRSYPVVDENKKVIGSISRYHLISSNMKKLILVDHNEKNQSIDDIDQAEIIEIIDHHRVANIYTTAPLFYRAEPVGSTATIISEMYLESGLRPSKEIAGLLCAAIISDTLLFRSPTTTDVDRRILDRMSKIADLNPEEFANQMFKAGTSLKEKSPTDIVEGDVKTFTINGEDVRVGQVMTMNPEELEPLRDEITKLMQEKIETKGETTFVLVLTDIFNETSELLVVGDHIEDIEEEFGNKVKNGTISAPGVLSRKKQVIPRLTNAFMKAN
ncbi:putative manganese-dependent inorganic diphosphatase [Anaerococcus sp. Marseille-Q5996]|uniref:putative manganese-dependent inorganic diphosphatase n=1 Tax=Anaerococcus sp. Marseille-Q5996 TaxID=2972769 RepID=UPI0021C61103|nr:putative manganese-dependent inorganic diphosphatase [Anaerococcus sp. Marseille-Q5996]